MAATLTGTPTAITWASGSDPAAQNITIPSDATAVYMFWSYYDGAAGNGLASCTLNSASPDQTLEIPGGGVYTASGVAVWYNPSTGTQSLDPAWDGTPSEGPTTIVAYVKGGDTTAWRDADAGQDQDTNAVTVTLTTVSGDLVLKYDQRYDGGGTPPSTSSGWTSAQTTANNGEASRLSYISASGSTQVCDSEDEAWSTVVAVSIPAGAASRKPSMTLLGAG